VKPEQLEPDVKPSMKAKETKVRQAKPAPSVSLPADYGHAYLDTSGELVRLQPFVAARHKKLDEELRTAHAQGRSKRYAPASWETAFREVLNEKGAPSSEALAKSIRQNLLDQRAATQTQAPGPSTSRCLRSA